MLLCRDGSDWLLMCGISFDWLLLCRDGSDWLFDELHKSGVPLLIFSAGVGDVVVEAVKQRGVLHSNVKVVSNFMDFDSQVPSSAFAHRCGLD